MSNLLEITGDDIAELNDSDLRSLIGLLCEADYRLAGISTKGITWGGHQDARDGGLDVVVRDTTKPPNNSFVPRNVTGFQVKKSNIPRSKILKEMRPKNVLRDSIKELIQENGAFIIVSSDSSTTETALKDRIEAMKDAVKDEEDYDNLHVDFLDRGRVATWARNHPSLILWIRNKIKRPLKGWQPYDNWANTPGGTEEEYLLDDRARLYDETKNKENKLTIDEGILRIRSVLSNPGMPVRMIGLSGVGKTRLVQVLFDQRVGAQALNRSQAFYTDVADIPEPDTATFANNLVSSNTRAILIVDNCSPSLHHRLTQICSKPSSTVSLLTVEYDVREDSSEKSSVFRLEPSSDELIEKIINKHYPHISQVDANTIAKFSGGNARVAIALANTMEQGDSLSSFKDEDLFERLFWQQQELNQSLLRSAEACSIVYSFEGKDTMSETSEIKFLGSLIDKSSADLYRDITELRRRDLIQTRNVWRAVLPHAIANRLAKRGLESIPKDKIVKSFLSNSSDRLIKSFSHRLSYLHDCESAIEIVNDWLEEDGWIGKTIDNLDNVQINIFSNISPVSPEKTLDAIERTAMGTNGSKYTSRGNRHYLVFVNILRQLAYRPELFDRSVEILIQFALSEDKDEKDNSTRDVLKSLFSIRLSGTHAPIKSRAKIITGLVESGIHERKLLALLLLESSMETRHFFSCGDFSFGARSRDYGYHPESEEEVTHWFDTYIEICTNIALSDESIAEKARIVLSNKLRGLWTNWCMYDSIEKSAELLHEKESWNGGWIAVRAIIRYDSGKFGKAVLNRLERLEKLLTPKELIERARTYALSDHPPYELDDDYSANGDMSEVLKRVNETTHRLGVQVSQSTEILNELLPDLVSKENNRTFIFGRGLADGCDSKADLLTCLISAIAQTPRDKRKIMVLLGFLSSCAESDQGFYQSTLDELIYDEVVGEWFPIIQAITPIDKIGLKRLHKSLDHGKAPMFRYEHINIRHSDENISDDDLAVLLSKILSIEKGLETTIEILQRWLIREKKDPSPCSDSLAMVAQDILTKYPYNERQTILGNSDYDLSDIAKIGLGRKNGEKVSKLVCERLYESLLSYEVQPSDYNNLLNTLAQAHPIIFLDIFIGGDEDKEHSIRWIFRDDFSLGTNPLNQISDEMIIDWCEIEPKIRYHRITLAIEAFNNSVETSELDWKPLVYKILERRSDIDSVLENIADRINPMSWGGSRADILDERLSLFQILFAHSNPKVNEWARKKYSDMQETIKKVREWEKSQNSEQDMQFEY